MKKIKELSQCGFCIIFLSLLILIACATAQTAETAPTPPYSFDRNIKINPPMAIILVTLISVFFAMGIVSVYVRQCAERRFANDFVHLDENSRRGAGRGIDPNVIDSFPMFLYSDIKDLKIGKSVLECAVCLNEFEDDETLRLLPKCCHVFHPDCIDAWLITHITCPVCRANLLPKPGDENITVLGHYTINSESPDPEFSNPVREVNDSVIDINVASPEIINIVQTPVHNRPPRSTPKREKIVGKFPRSHSTGHSLIQPGQDCERFTLRLPEEVRNKLINSGLSREQGNPLFPRERSVRNGYRSSSVGTGSAPINHGNYERFNEEGREDRWGFMNVPPFFSRGGSTRSSKDSGGAGDDLMAVNKNLFKTVKFPFDRIFEKDSTGERSFNKL
ncbi:PREDICTED: RING-H2 finger protein ATL11-like [Nicotiana attenuata]|uniref:RING-type E3 ubiquitin transferase n=1 Tax=Nicotiana attenuata TaxID=49451 RepID=A0A1J6KLD3_NICAT|nr:PREDICTED: RING-H2 finger protein ATL11-like [Nicotiana attenuata]OIT25696.1 ring-h2 finger protein atl11 [Nicotiana attenuata]